MQDNKTDGYFGLYSTFPNILLRDEEIPYGAVVLYAIINSLCNNVKNYCYAKNYTLEKITRLSRNSIAKYLRLLKEKGFIETEVIRNDRNEVMERRIWVRVDFRANICQVEEPEF